MPSPASGYRTASVRHHSKHERWKHCYKRQAVVSNLGDGQPRATPRRNSCLQLASKLSPPVSLHLSWPPEQKILSSQMRHCQKPTPRPLTSSSLRSTDPSTAPMPRLNTRMKGCSGSSAPLRSTLRMSMPMEHCRRSRGTDGRVHVSVQGADVLALCARVHAWPHLPAAQSTTPRHVESRCMGLT